MFESFKRFMKRVLPEFLSFKYLLYYYFCKSEVDESKVLSQGIDKSELFEAVSDGSAAYFT